jgi:hypothetical protein
MPKQRKPPDAPSSIRGPSLGSNVVNEDKPRRRKPAAPPSRRQVKASVLVDAELSARWAAAAALRGQTRNAFAIDALTEALRGIVVFDRRKSAGHASPDTREDRQEETAA